MTVVGFDRERRGDGLLQTLHCALDVFVSASLSRRLFFVWPLILLNWQSKEFISGDRRDTRLSPGFTGD